jgi:hypothetical protein
VQEPQFSNEEQLIAEELRRTFLLDPDLSTFGRGASDAAFSLGWDIAVVGKKVGGHVWELTLSSSREFYQKAKISSREPLRQTVGKIEKGVCCHCPSARCCEHRVLAGEDNVRCYHTLMVWPVCVKDQEMPVPICANLCYDINAFAW